jgi:hypothetical protein
MTMSSRAAFCAATGALLCSLVACAGHTGGPSVEMRTEDIEVPLDLTMESVQLVRGRMRFTASMDEGSPDVSVWLGPRCEAREIGRGIATGTRVVWTLSADELGRALECQLTLKARGFRGEEARVRKVAELPVRIGMNMVEYDEDSPPRLRSQTTEGAITRFLFVDTPAAATLRVGNFVVGREFVDDLDLERRQARFLVPNDALARAVLSRRIISLRGAIYEPSLTIRGCDLEPEETIDTGENID